MRFDESAILAITRPKDQLWTYYLLTSLAALVAAPFMAAYLYFRFHTMRYRFDNEGISMSWGVLFHHEIILNYNRIQDIHLRSTVVERWLGLARIEVQTASAGSGAEMTLEGLEHVEEVRDYLYSRMRGAASASTKPVASSGVAAALHEVAAELQSIRKTLAEREGGKR